MNRVLYTLIVLLALAGILQVLTGCVPAKTSFFITGQWRSVSSPEGGFQLLIPEKWLFDEVPTLPSDPTLVATLTSPGGVNAVFGNFRRSETAFASLNEVAQWSESVYTGGQITRMLQDYRASASNPLNVKGEETLIREFTYTEPLLIGQSIHHCLDNYRLHQGRGYLIRFCLQDSDYQTLKPTLDQMIESFTYLQ